MTKSPAPVGHRASIDDLRAVALFDGLSDEQLLQLLAVAEGHRFVVGDELFHEARPADNWWVLLSGTVELLRHVGHEETVLGAMVTPGQWAGGFLASDPHERYMATGRGAAPGHLLRVPAERLRELADSWFPLGVHFLQGLMNTVRTIESMARQREALVALGTLAAGLAHEINNPAAAAGRAVAALDESCQTLLDSLGQLAGQSISAAQFTALDALRREFTPPDAPLNPMRTADLEDALSDWLVRHDVDRDWVIAPTLAAAGLDIGWCDRVAAVLDGPALQFGLEWVASSLSTATLLAEARESTRRISELVAAVKSYAQLDRASLQQITVSDGLESTLVMLSHRLGGVSVVRDYGPDVPQIDANAGELNQVWTNLIDNAVDAMSESGTLLLRTRARGGGIIVGICDTATGCRNRSARTRSSRSSPPRASARERASGWTSPGGSPSSGTAGRSASSPSPARRWSGSASRRDHRRGTELPTSIE